MRKRVSDFLQKSVKPREESHTDANLRSSLSHVVLTTRRGRFQSADAHHNVGLPNLAPPLSTDDPGRWVAPELPDEVVRQIMLSAADSLPSPYSSHCWGPITSAISTPFLLRANYDEELEFELQKKSQRTKIALSMVSKLWRDLSADVLFNTILLSNYGQISLLSRALDRDKSRRGGLEGPGCWAWLVRRLWVARPFRFEYLITPEDGMPSFSVSDLIRRCPKIVNFRNFGQFTNERDISWHTLPQRRQIFRMIMRPDNEQNDHLEKPPPAFSPILLDIDLDVSSMHLDFIEHGSSFRFIQVLKFQWNTPYNTWPETMRNDVEFPVLEYLHINDARWFAQATLFRMPALRRLSFCPSIVSPYLQVQEQAARKQTIVLFLERHGGGLEELSIISRLRWELDLNSLCPNLVSLNVVALDYVGRTAKLFFDQTSHQKVSQVGFSGLQMDGFVEWEDSDVFFSPLFLSFPSLQIVRDLTWNLRIIEELAQSWSCQPSILRPREEVWLRALELMQERSVRFVDCRGINFRKLFV